MPDCLTTESIFISNAILSRSTVFEFKAVEAASVKGREKGNRLHEEKLGVKAVVEDGDKPHFLSLRRRCERRSTVWSFFSIPPLMITARENIRGGCSLRFREAQCYDRKETSIMISCPHFKNPSEALILMPDFTTWQDFWRPATYCPLQKASCHSRGGYQACVSSGHIDSKGLWTVPFSWGFRRP